MKFTLYYLKVSCCEPKWR